MKNETIDVELRQE